ncbi:hypothetical protein [Vibrio ouci]|uniref:Lysozyme inhibitor n=1 Tax=Vibrio ouci TaxID=2499078 RepID=A0A4Y8WKV0_9VIBR|nr:hypothetical protein [Vibrio ouci]TFH93323.1 hypothetical protein ELS82_02610 [Vibrio ouci]
MKFLIVNKAVLLSTAFALLPSLSSSAQPLSEYAISEFTSITCKLSGDTLQLTIESDETTPDKAKLSIQTTSRLNYRLSSNSRYALSLKHPTDNITLTLSTDTGKHTLVLKPNCQLAS